MNAQPELDSTAACVTGGEVDDPVAVDRRGNASIVQHALQDIRSGEDVRTVVPVARGFHRLRKLIECVRRLLHDSRDGTLQISA